MWWVHGVGEEEGWWGRGGVGGEAVLRRIGDGSATVVFGRVQASWRLWPGGAWVRRAM